MDFFPLVGPVLRRLEPETAHHLTVWSLAHGLAPHDPHPDDPRLASQLWGVEFPNPIGLAAGFDKNAEAIDALLGLGFGFVEAGTVTPRPQPGNPRPRVFRLPEQWGMINRYGFNNDGLEPFRQRFVDRTVRAARSGRKTSGIVGANVGKNKDTVEAAEDYTQGVRAMTPLADYLVINVSSPNTPGLRALQGREPLANLLRQSLDARNAAMAGCDRERPPPLLLKVAPDLTDDDRQDVAEVALESGIDGLIISNTTITRPPGLPPERAEETGGLSGKPLFDLSTAVLADLYARTQGQLPLIGVGGIASGADAYAKIRAGASLVQLYTALVYGGPSLLWSIKRDLAALLRRDGFATLSEAVGTGGS